MPKNKVLLFYGMFEDDQSYDWIPYGPLCVYSRLKSAGFEPILIHEYTDRNYRQIIEEHAKDTLLFGVSAMTGRQISSGIDAVKHFRQSGGGVTPVIWGGAHATAVPHETLMSEHVDYVCVGHVKENFLNFVVELRDNGHLTKKHADILTLDDFVDPDTKESILVPERTVRPNTALKIPALAQVEATVGDFWTTSDGKEYSAADSLYDFATFPPIPFEDFDFSPLMTENKVLNYTASIGCPASCSFCSWGGKHRWSNNDIDQALNDIEYLVNRYELSSLWFNDSTLAVKKDYLLGLAEGILDRKLPISWRCNARVPELGRYTKSDFALLAKSGLDRLFLGVESVNKEVLTLFNKSYNTELVTKIVEDLQGIDIQIMMSFILGNPISLSGGLLTDLEENRQALTKWQEMNPNVRFQVCFHSPYPGTPTTDLCIKQGYTPPATLEEYDENPMFSTRGRKYDDIPWYSEEDQETYLKRYAELFPQTDDAPEWNWRIVEVAGQIWQRSI